MNNHIGNFQPLYHYHLLYPSAVRKLNDGERMMLLKKSIGGDIRKHILKISVGGLLLITINYKVFFN